MCIILKCLRQQRKHEAKKQADLKSSETNLLKKLDWDVNDEQDISSALFGAPLTLGAQGKLSQLPPPVGGTGSSHAGTLDLVLSKY